MTLWAFETTQEVSFNVPDTHTVTERASSDISRVWGNGDIGDTIFNAETELLLTRLDVPEPYSLVTARSDSPTIGSEGKGIDSFLMTRESIPNLPSLNVPYLSYMLVANFEAYLSIGMSKKLT